MVAIVETLFSAVVLFGGVFACVILGLSLLASVFRAGTDQ